MTELCSVSKIQLRKTTGVDVNNKNIYNLESFRLFNAIYQKKGGCKSCTNRHFLHKFRVSGFKI